ncbi:hypothetical protein GCM10011581_24650 [Saccharopolyspora subtropica]|uniref:4-hydroxybenzoate polyprenyltransferase n=1 Tax=Saccharopolyspora thermophila TaxID=89367 RepID=A0A917JVH8_9PSEU|nr:UbiA family prenyltransferase [Saccharopolyspora subtropica]GGI86610.1 hypothetical protein GCM10011581_24650 [Saccharopolyspora subtropica]
MRHLATACALVRASHPVPAFGVTAIATGLAATTGRGAAGLLLTAAAVLAGQLSVGWLNDLVDAERDARVGRCGKPIAAGVLSRDVVLVAVVVAALVAVLGSVPFGAAAAAAHVLALVSAWAYDLGVKAGPLSVVPYAVSFGLLLAFVTLGSGNPPPLWLVLAGALLGSAAHFANVLPDLHDDAVTGVRGLPHRLGAAGSSAVAAALVLAASTALVFGPPGLAAAGWVVLPGAALVLVVGLVLGRRPGARTAFHAVLLVALLDVVLLLGAGVSPS